MKPINLHGAHPVVVTASGELAGVMAKAASGRLRAFDTIHLGLFEELPNRLDLIRRGLVNLHNVAPVRDAFECLRDGGALYLLGSTPRGVLHAVYALEERLVFGPELPLQPGGVRGRNGGIVLAATSPFAALGL